MIERMMIVGGSRGIGAAMAARYVDRVPNLLTVSRTPSAVGIWKPCDLTRPEEIESLVYDIGPTALDALLILAGTWEAGAFTDAYRFEQSPPDETVGVIAVNLVGPILLVQALLPQLCASSNPRVVLIGALSGRDGGATAEVANTASKFGLRGAAQALRLALKGSGVSVSLINPGNVATDEVQDDIASGRFGEQTPIGLSDLAAAIDCALAMSTSSTITEIDIAQRFPG